MQACSLITPVLLAGGTGSRLWPLSRPERPKQFLPLLAEGSPFQAAYHRYRGPGFGAPLVVTAPQFADLARKALHEAGAPTGGAAPHLLLEPERRNTAAAALASAELLAASARHGPDTLVLIAPTDHAVPDGASLRNAVLHARAAALEGALVVIGVQPSHPSTELGWIVLEAPCPRHGTRAGHPRPVARFVEKPSLAEATRLHADHRSLWNAGLVLATVASLRRAARAHAPALLAGVAEACARAERQGDALRPAAGPWQALPSISLDRAILEKASGLMCMPWHGQWSDMGTWEALVAARTRETLLARAPHPGYEPQQAIARAAE